MSFETLPENRERRWRGEVCREAVPQIGGEDLEGPLADGSKVEGWHDQLVGGRRSKSQSRWHISDLGEVRRQIRGRTARRVAVLEQ